VTSGTVRVFSVGVGEDGRGVAIGVDTDDFTGTAGGGVRTVTVYDGVSSAPALTGAEVSEVGCEVEIAENLIEIYL